MAENFFASSFQKQYLKYLDTTVISHPDQKAESKNEAPLPPKKAKLNPKSKIEVSKSSNKVTSKKRKSIFRVSKESRRSLKRVNEQISEANVCKGITGGDKNPKKVQEESDKSDNEGKKMKSDAYLNITGQPNDEAWNNANMIELNQDLTLDFGEPRNVMISEADPMWCPSDYENPLNTPKATKTTSSFSTETFHAFH